VGNFNFLPLRQFANRTAAGYLTEGATGNLMAVKLRVIDAKTVLQHIVLHNSQPLFCQIGFYANHQIGNRLT
jgi:hypothetical protein